MKEISVKFGIVFLIVIIFLSMGQSQGNKEDDEVIKEVKKEENVKVAVTVNDDVNYVDLDEYLLGVVAGEMPANFEKEALKAQVVASRTYVYNRNLSVDNTTNTQVYLDDSEMKKKWGDNYNEYYEKIKSAVAETKNEVMMYQGDIIAYKKSGRVETLSVGGKNYSGREVREKLGLPSSCFTIDYANGKYTFTTKGSGHGVGMSQYGAQAMALDGASYKDILNHYYTGIEIVNN